MSNDRSFQANPTSPIQGSLEPTDASADSPEEKTGESVQEPLRHIDVDENNASKGLAQLVLTLIKLLHDLLEKQAVGRMESGTLTEEETERIGRTLKKQLEEIEHICDVFGLDVDDLDLNLGTIKHHDVS